MLREIRRSDGSEVEHTKRGVKGNMGILDI